MHSRWNGYEERSLFGCGVYPLRRTSPHTPLGPSARMDDIAGADEGQTDVVDEALYMFKPHMFFRTFPVKGAGDRTVLYVTIHLHECIKKIAGMRREEAAAALRVYAMEPFPSPCEKEFRFSTFFPSDNRAAQDDWQQYARQLRMEAGARLVEKVFLFPEADGTGSKFWMCFARRTFLGSD